jgi:imidazole glycerol phosphate synthase glutamine amidotransferase subunit
MENDPSANSKLEWILTEVVKILGTNAGNVASLRMAFKRIGFFSEQINCVGKLRSSDILVLPGMYNTYEYFETVPDLMDIHDMQKSGKIKKILGICAGFQILTSRIEERGKKFTGIGLLDAITKPISADKSNCNGWRRCSETIDYLCSFGTPKNGAYGLYYNHSCGVYPDDKMDYRYSFLSKKEFAVAFQSENVFAFQFHPEKSGLAGSHILSKVLQNNV